MGIEEKAKAYDEALEKARCVLHTVETAGCVMHKDLLEEIFPELRESEDERIRKWILEKVQGYADSGIPCSDEIQMANKALSWLEEQKDKNCLACDQHLKGYIAGRKVTEEEKQKEQKPEVKDPFDDEQFRRGYEAGRHDAMKEQVEMFVDEYNKGYEAGRLEGCTAGYNKAMKEVEQKPTKWTDLTWKDINELERIINNVHYEFQNGIGEDSFGELVLERFREYKEDEDTDEKEQKPVEWSEEDEKMLKNVLFVLESYVSRSESASSPSLITTYPTYYKEIDWLKSLRPHLKPSEDEEMDKECIELCEVLNSIPSVETFESCCGHLKDRYSIWFFSDSIDVVSRLGRCVERNYSDGKWELLVDSTDTHPTGVFWLRSKIPFQSYDEMNESIKGLCNSIRHWFNTKFDSYFNGDSGK